MIIFLISLLLLIILNFIVLFLSKDANVYQLFLDLEKIKIVNEFDEIFIILVISISVSMMTMLLLFIFKPFIDVYLLHYFRYSFYFLISLLSSSTIYIVFRIYGYSRFYLLLYLLIGSSILYISEKIR